MKPPTIILLAALLVCALGAKAQGTAFTYQGRLITNGAPYTGSAEFQFTLWDAASGGNAVATNNPASVITAVTDGLFTVTLDFGINPFNGQPRFLQIDARTAIGPFTTLSPRQPVTATPYALRALSLTTNGLVAGTYASAVTFNNAANNFSGTLTGNGAGLTSLNASQLTSGTVPEARLSANLARLNASQTFSGGNTFSGANTFNHPGSSFTGNGSGLTGLSASQLANGTVPDPRLAANIARTTQIWLLGGNAGTMAGTHFLGTTDDEPLEFKVNGQRGLRIEPNTNGAPNIIGGSANNVVDVGVIGAFIGGGGSSNSTNRISSNFSSIVNGLDNLIQTNARFSTIVGGQENEIQSGASSAAIGGGFRNTITNADYAFIGAGLINSIENATYGAIGSGVFNNILSQSGGTIGGGTLNQLGGTNIAGSSSGTGSNSHNAIVGGILNWIAAGASHGFIGGGRSNFIGNGANFAAVPGGRNNRAAGDYSFAAGRLAKADHDGAFVWADSQNANFASTGSNQFLIRASGGVGIGTNDPASALHVNGTVNIGGGDLNLAAGSQILADPGSNAAPGISFRGDPNTGMLHPLNNTITFVTSGVERLRLESTGFFGIGTNNPAEKLHVIGNILATGTITPNSDRNAKTDILPVDTAAILERVSKMPIQQWRFKAEAENVKHVGPMAQDFRAAFGLGAHETAIATVDADGVALAAIQGLNQKLTKELKQKATEITELKERLEALEKSFADRNPSRGTHP